MTYCPLQLYPKYTLGEPGTTSTDDGEIVVLDLPVLLGSSPPGHHKQPPLPPSSSSSVSAQQQPSTSSPPVGMMLFDIHTGSQENSLSCEQEQLSCDHLRSTPQAEDILIAGPLSEIRVGVREDRRGWGVHHGMVEEEEGDNIPSQDSLLQLNQLDVDDSPSHAQHPHSADENGMEREDGLDHEWYDTNDEEDGVRERVPARQHSKQSPHSPDKSRVHSRKVDSHRQSLDDDNDVLSEENGEFEGDSGPVRIRPKLKGQKSLEALTRISSDKEPVRRWGGGL